MRYLSLHCLCALCGAYALQLCSYLPDRLLCIALVPVSIGLYVLRQARPVASVLSGFLLLAFAAQSIIDDRLSPELVGTTVSIDARVVDFPRDNGASLGLLVEPLWNDNLPGRIRLSWFDAPSKPAIGETWRLEVRMRRPRGFSNPGGLDYEAWLFRQSIGATGYVVNSPRNRRRDKAASERTALLRRQFVGRIEQTLPHDDAAAVLMAVAVGARHAITREQWNRYAATGTSHLMAISGLHIGLAAGCVYLISWVLLALFCRRANIRDYAAVVAAVAAVTYAELSGFAVPARRALLMTIVVVLVSVLRRQISAAKLLAICCLIIMLTEPLTILAPGFQLSFAAVAILFWHLRVTRLASTANRRRPTGMFVNGVRRLCSTQWALLFGLFPLTAILFDRVAPLAAIVNLLALPVFSFVTVPACLFGLMLDGPLQSTGNFVLDIAYRSVCVVLWLIRHAAELPLADIYIARPEGLFAVVILMPALYSLLPPGWPGRELAIVAALAVILYEPPPPPQDCIDVHALDVGQGLSVVLRTRNHTAVFDTGPSFRGGSDTGRLVLLPFLRSKGVRLVDLLIVSHADQDHAGGARSLTRAMPVKDILSGEALDDIEQPTGRCQSGVSWQWDGIHFSILHPSNGGDWRGNNASCVLEVRAGRHRTLLTGDIESPVERMLAAAGNLHTSDIVFIPHHGSRTSSSEGFVRLVRPRVAVVSAGFNNRWGFPKDDVVRKWQSAGAEVLNTATSGAISYRSCADVGVRRPVEHRISEREYWHD